MKRILLALLRLRGMHFLATRTGSTWLRSLAFDEKYRSGEWDFLSNGRDELVEVISKYANRGSILMMGCGSASVLAHLNSASFSTLLGIDLSGEAISLADKRFARDRVRFRKADMLKFQCPQLYDLIVFSESIYYIPSSDQIPLLDRLSKCLKPGGHFIVTIAETQRYEAIFAQIRLAFRVEEDRRFSGSERHLMVFSSHCGGNTQVPTM